MTSNRPKRSHNHVVCAALALVAAGHAPGRAEGPAVRPTAAVAPAAAPDGAADFDFLVGTWKIQNRIRDGWLTGSTAWYEFAATATERAIWGGRGIVEEWDGVSPKRRIQGVALRLYDPTAKNWKIYWADARDGTVLFPPAVGTFQGGRGEFFSEGSVQGKPTRERILWIKLTKDTLRWEQAYSGDGGKTWETNWIMSFTRVAP